MTSSPSPFANTNKLQVLPNSTTLLFTASPTNNLTLTNPIQNIRPTVTPNGTFIHQPQQATIATPTNIVRLNQPVQNQNQFTQQTIWTNNSPTQLSPKVQFTPMVKAEPSTPVNIQQQSSILPTKLVAQPVVRQTVAAPQAPRFTEAQINDFVGKCRTFLTTLLKLAEKQAPEKLPMVKTCIQNLLDGSIDPESFTQRLHTLYKSQPHTSLVPFFKLALPHMRRMVQATFNAPITIELLERLNLPSSKTTATATVTTTTTTTTPATPSRVVVNPSLLTSQSNTLGQQPLLYTTVQPQQKINLLQQTAQPALISATPSLLGQQQQQQQQARAQISIAGIRPLLTTVSPSSNTNLLTGQTQIQPVTQTIIQPADSLLQRSFLSSSTATSGGLQQPHIITVNQQPLRTEIRPNQQPQIQIQQRTILKNDDETMDDTLGNNSLLTTSSGPSDDRHARHITHDNRLLLPSILRRRLDHLVKKDKRWEGGAIFMQDDSVAALISHATEERLKFLIEQIRSASQKRESLMISMMEKEEEEKQGKKRSAADDSNLYEEWKKLRPHKRQCRVHLHDLISTMEKDKHLKRSTLLYKALDKSSS